MSGTPIPLSGENGGASAMIPPHLMPSASPEHGQVTQPPSPVSFMVGNSPVMHEVFEQIRRYATCDIPVLITGESGTGKELVARAIHNRSSRAAGQFVAINCAAVPATLIASELFGYEKGAFTGANSRKRGQIELAHRGTLLLDEIGDMPLDLQGHLLRFLQEGEIVRVGGHEPIKVDVRVIAATHVRVQEAIGAGRLREDLYYRLNVLNIHMPPLRERHGDIEVLAAYFLHQIARDLGRDVRSFSPDAVSALEGHDWPGNVRELIATIRRAVVLCDSEQIQRADLRLCAVRLTTQLSVPSVTRPAPSSDAERDMLRGALQRHGFNVTRTAQDLRVSRVTLYRMLARNRLTVRHDCVAQDQSVNAVSDVGSANGLLSS